jgi:acetoin utilization protein AcuC
MCKIIYHPKYKLYDLGDGHPFNPIRAEMVLDLLKELGCPVNCLEPQPVTPEVFYSIHDETYVNAIEALSRGQELQNAEMYGLGTVDNPIAKGMAEGARYQAGGTLLAARLLIEEKAKRVLQLGGGFHHAHKSMAAGFCIYNDLALAIKEMTNHGWHIAYIDVDVHHGDGVQEIFYSDGKVMTISLHESGEYLFPGTGFIHELGQGMGRSLKLNVPLDPFTEGESYLEVMDGVIKPALKWFRPDALVVMVGADAHFSDPLADLMLTTIDYENIFRKVLSFADHYSKGRIMFTLGGGYSLSATPRIWSILYLMLLNLEIPPKISRSWIQKWEKLTGQKLPELLHDEIPAFDPIQRKPEIVKHNRDLIIRINDSVAQYWI